jgi:hypothetical protein
MHSGNWQRPTPRTIKNWQGIVKDLRERYGIGFKLRKASFLMDVTQELPEWMPDCIAGAQEGILFVLRLEANVCVRCGAKRAEKVSTLCLCADCNLLWCAEAALVEREGKRKLPPLRVTIKPSALPVRGLFDEEERTEE